MQLNVRLTDVEFGLLAEWSEAEHLRVAEYVRSKLFGSGSRAEPVFGDEDLSKKEVEEVLSRPSPPRKVQKGKMCRRCSNIGRPSCEACRKAAAKSALDVFDVESLVEGE